MINKTMKKKVLLPVWIILALPAISACSNDEPQDEVQDNVLQHQIDAMDKAKEVEGMLEEVEKQRREQAME